MTTIDCKSEKELIPETLVSVPVTRSSKETYTWIDLFDTGNSKYLMDENLLEKHDSSKQK